MEGAAMDEKIQAIRNEATTFQDMASTLMALALRLEPATSAATIRSMNTAADAFRAELFNLQKLLDEFPAE